MVDILLVPCDERRDDVIGSLRAAANVYGWGIESDIGDDGLARVRVVPGTCTRQPEPRRVLERARLRDAALVGGVAIERMPVRMAARR